MGFLDRAIKGAISNAVGDAVEKGVRKAVAPKVEQAATNAVNSAAAQFNRAAGIDPAAPAAPAAPSEAQSTLNRAELDAAANTFGSLFGGLAGAANTFANEAAKNMKICPNCGEGAGAQQAFCPSCGTKLPEQTVAQGAVCSSCGMQNGIGTKFCAGCGAKLPCALAEEEAARAQFESVLASWGTLLPNYPKWCFGGTSLSIDHIGSDVNGYPFYEMKVSGTNPGVLGQYKALLSQNGFRQAGEYPSETRLYKMVGNVCYCFDSGDPFPYDAGEMVVRFTVGEPQGGFNYEKPAPKSTLNGIFDLFK